MTGLIAAACLFLGIHLAVSGTKLRDVLTGAMGEKPYLGLFVASSLGALVWLCIAYNRACAGTDNPVLFEPGQMLRNGAIPVLALAFALAVPGVLMGNPTSAGQENAGIGGVLRITRHPFLWGTTLWSGFHLVGSGTLASTVFFATFFVLGTVGTLTIDAKVRRKRPAHWQAISAQTSNIPFAAIAAGRNKFVPAEYFDWRFSVATVLFAVLLYFHNDLFSMSPFPNNWLPS
jgi:uncharacterized membrane protein